MKINGKTKLYAIVGNPVTHSFSPAMHNAAFTATGINGVYVAIGTPDIRSCVQGLKDLGFCGASITVPHKIEVMADLDAIDPLAQRIGAVNTLVIDRDTEGQAIRCTGYNTDWKGAIRALEEQTSLAEKTAVVLGAGGSARAVSFGLLEAGAKVIIANRTQSKAESLAADLQNIKPDVTAIPLQELESIGTADILINTTSVGMNPHPNAMPIAPELLTRYQVVMDIVYAPLQTQLLKAAQEHGCITIDGLQMLQYQAVEQFLLWTGEEPPAGLMRSALLDALAAQAKEAI